MSSILLKIVNYLAIFGIFSGALTYDLRSFAELRIIYVTLPTVILILLFSTKRLVINKKFLFYFLALFLFSLYNVFMGNNTMLLLFKQTIGILLVSTAFYLVIKANSYDIIKLFKIYLVFAFVVALIGILQQIGFILGIHWLYDYRPLFVNSNAWNFATAFNGHFIRINSILHEPSTFCLVLMPAFFAAISSLFLKKEFSFYNRFQCCVIILSLLSSFSATGYLGMLLAILIFFKDFIRRTKWRVIILSSLVLFFVIFFTVIPELKMRVADTVNIINGGKKFDCVNSSTYALGSNFIITYKSFREHPFIGSGLGSYKVVYDKHIGSIFAKMQKRKYVLNDKDANSLFLRLSAETGIFGILIFFGFLFKLYLKRRDDANNYLWIINNASLIYFFLKLLRSGHYFIEGFFFFFWVYYFSKIKSRDNRL